MARELLSLRLEGQKYLGSRDPPWMGGENRGGSPRQELGFRAADVPADARDLRRRRSTGSGHRQSEESATSIDPATSAFALFFPEGKKGRRRNSAVRRSEGGGKRGGKMESSKIKSVRHPTSVSAGKGTQVATPMDPSSHLREHGFFLFF